MSAAAECWWLLARLVAERTTDTACVCGVRVWFLAARDRRTQSAWPAPKRIVSEPGAPRARRPLTAGRQCRPGCGRT
jgi:hypothetical protein